MTKTGTKKNRVYPHVWKSGPDPVRHAQFTAWHRARAQAHYRGEEWEITFEEYADFWTQSGVWHQRGRTCECVLMSRVDPEKPWRIDNLFITTRREHLSRKARLQHQGALNV